MNALQSQVQQQLKKQFAFLDDPNISGTPTPKQVDNMEKIYGNPKTQRLSAKEREANLEAFNSNLTENARQTGQAFMQNTAGRPIEERYEMQKEAQNAFKAQLSHLSEEQQQLALDTFNAETDVLKQADNEAGVIARTGDLLSYIPSTATRFGEQLTGLFSPDGDWRKWFTDATKEVESWRSDESKLRNYINAQNLAQAKANGESGFTQYLTNAVNAPLETIGQFAESAIPTIASGVIGAAAAPVTGGASLALPFAIGGVQGAGETRNNIYDHIMAMPETQLAQSPEYQALLAKGLSPAQARNELASSLTEHGGEILATGVSSAILNKLGGLGRIGQAGKGVLGSTTGKFVSEALTEPADEVFQQLMGNKAIHDIDPTHSLSDGLGEAAAGGLLFGVAGGGLAAADNSFRTEKTANQPEAPVVNPESPTQPGQPTALPINSQALDEALKPYQDSEEYAEMRSDLERDIEDGVIEERAKSNSQYGKLAQAYLNATEQATAEPQAVKNPQNVAPQAEAELQQTANTAPTAPRNVLTGSQDSVDVGENDYQPFQYEVMEADDLAPTQQKAGTLEQAKNAELENNLRFSLNESSNSPFAKAVDTVANGGQTTGKYIPMGTTPDVLKMLGLPDANIRISDEVIHKVMSEYLGYPKGNRPNIHNLSPEVLKQLPTQLNNPVAVFNSSTRENAYVVLTELFETKTKTGKTEPVIAALHIKPTKNDVEVLNITSVYGRGNGQLKTAFNNDLRYVNKEKAQQILNTQSLQLGWDFTSDVELSTRNIKTETDLSQYQNPQSERNVEPESNEQLPQESYSRSPIKSVEANIKRGREAMNKAIAERRTVHRAMFNHNLDGWVDFEWGDDGLTKPFNKKGEPVGKGISHIIEARMRKDGMSYEDVTRMLTQNIVDTIAKGKVYKEATLPNGKVKNVQLDYNGHRAVLIKKQGNNGWILTAFELHPTDVNSAGSVDTERTTNTKPTLTRQGMGAFDRNNVQQSEAKRNQQDAEQTHVRELLRRALGQHADKIELVRDEQFGEKDARRGAEGWYHNGKLYLNLDGITDGNILSKDERLVWVAWHELGHHGVEVQFSQVLKNQLRQARKNVVVNGIAKRIFAERQAEAKRENNPSLAISQDVATEEAIVELFAAMETGNWAEIESRYRVHIVQEWRQPQSDLVKRLSHVANFFKRLVAKITGKNLDTVSNQEVLNLLATVKQGIAKSAENTTASEARYSLSEESDSDFAKAVDVVTKKLNALKAGEQVNGYPNQPITLGTTPDVLKMLGYADVDVQIGWGTVEKIMRQHFDLPRGKHSNIHNLSPDVVKQIPQQLNNPVAIYESGTKDGALVVLTELSSVEKATGKESPVVVALHFAERQGKLNLINVASAYERNANTIARDDLSKRNVLYVNKAKGQTLIEKDPSLQLASVFSEGFDLSANDIKTETDLSQYQAENSSTNQEVLTVKQGIAKSAENTTASEARYSLSEESDSDFAKAVDEVFNSLETRFDNNRWIELGTTPEPLIQSGITEEPMYINFAKIGKIKNDHPEMTADLLKQIPKELNNPVAVFKNTKGKANSYVVLTELSVKGNERVIAALHADQEMKGLVFHKLASAYGKDGTRAYLENMIEKSDVRFVDKQKAGRINSKLQLLADDTLDLLFNKASVVKDESGVNGGNLSTNFKRWFGNSKVVDENSEPLFSRKQSRSNDLDVDFENAMPKRTANSFAQVKELAKAFLNKTLHNDETGIDAVISRANLEKMLSGKAHAKSTSLHDHLLAVANVDSLFKNAIHGWTEPYNKNDSPDVVGVHKMFAPFNIDGNMKLVKLTVKELKPEQGNRVYSVETIEIGNEKAHVPEMAELGFDSNSHRLHEGSSTLGNLEATANQNDQLTSPQSANIQSLIQRIQDFNSRDENSEPLFSRKQTSMEILTDGKVKHETLWGTVKAGEFGKIWNEVQRKTDFALTDETRPVLDWIGDLDLAQVQANELKSDFELADGVRHSLNSQLMQRFLKPLHKNIVRLAKKRKKDIEWTKKALGIWVSANYSIQKNQELLARDEQAMRDAQQAFDEAKANGTAAEIDKAERAYIRAERQYRYRKHDVEINNWEVDEKGNFIVPRKVGVAGFSIPHAKALMAEVEKHFTSKEVQEATEPLRKAVEWNVRKNREFNRITEEQFKEYMRNLDYVPLTGDPDSLLKDDDDFIGGASSKGVNTSLDKNMKGRVNSEAEDAIDAVYRMLDKTVANAAWQPFKNGIDTVYEQKLAEAKTQGMTEEQAKEHVADTVGIRRQVMQGTTRTNDEVLIRKFGNVYYEYRLPEEVIKAIKGGQRDVDEFKIWQHKLSPMRYVRKLTGLYAQGVTQFKLPFAPKNMIRDIWEKSALITTRDIYDTNGKPLRQKFRALSRHYSH